MRGEQSKAEEWEEGGTEQEGDLQRQCVVESKGAWGRSWTWLRQEFEDLLLAEQEMPEGCVMLSGTKTID